MEEMNIEPKRFNKKKVLPIVILGLLVIGLASAALVSYLSNTITEEITVESPIVLEGTEFELEITTAGEDGFMLVKITNMADVDITGDIEIAISPDAVGIAIAITEDINYCFKDQGDMTDIFGNCEGNYMIWMANNIDWNDWYANADYTDAEYPSPLVINYGGDSFHSLGGYVNNTLVLPGLTMPAGETVYGVIYVATDIALTPTTYTFDMTFVP